MQALNLHMPIVGLTSFFGMLELNDAIIKQRNGGDYKDAKGAAEWEAKVKTIQGKTGIAAGSNLNMKSALTQAILSCQTLREDVVSQIDVRSAKATVPRDREQILRQIDEALGTKQTRGTEQLTLSVRSVADDCIRLCTAFAFEAWSRQRGSSRWSAAAKTLAAAGAGD
jgi:hypothetical protein